ncbi:MAG: hypothetical protein ABS42_00325 [Bdellovibrio sp. SCN 50-8]|nr:MAG: hypothetical protein ABS42_00325 [Bdellovibrio sp. SCN 50-8]
MSSEERRPLAPIWCFAILIFCLAALYVPMLVMAAGAFRTADGWGLDAFGSVLSNSYWMDALANSLWVAIFSAIGSTLLGLLAALAGSGVFLGSMLALAMVLPEIVFALILLTWFAFLGFDLGLVTVILAHITFSVSFSYLIIRSRFEKLDPLLFEAAADLGAGGLGRLFSVTLPLLKPALISSFFIAFLLSFDDFLISFFVNGVGTDTLPMKLYASMKMGMTSELNALATIMVLISALCILGISWIRLKTAQN